MYIKRVTKSNRGSRRLYQYLHLVENVRTENGPRQRLILNLGTLDLAPERYKDLANCIEATLTGQQQMFSSDPHLLKLARKAADKIRIRGAVEQSVEKSHMAAPSYQQTNTGRHKNNDP